MGILSKLAKVSIRGVVTVGAVAVDVVTCAVLLPPKMFTDSKDATPFLTENAGKKFLESVKEFSQEIDSL